jgi:hypothetical protein
MAWTLALLLVVGSIVLVTYLHRTIQKIRKNAFVYPSEAVIDQILPPVSLDLIFYMTLKLNIKFLPVESSYYSYSRIFPIFLLITPYFFCDKGDLLFNPTGSFRANISQR